MIMGGDKKKLATILVEKIGGKKDEEGAAANKAAFEKMAGEPESQIDEGLLSGAEDVMAAINAGEPKRVAEALRDFFYICDSMPHLEGEHEDIEE
jgi:hypothetical protein